MYSVYKNTPSTKRMSAQFESNCTSCGCRIFKGQEIIWTRGVGSKHSTPLACATAKQLRLDFEAKQAAERAAAPKLATHPIIDFLKAAQQRGLKNPKLRVLDTDFKTELLLSLTRGGVAPGSLSIKRGFEFAGVIRLDGTLVGRVASDSALQQHLLIVAQNPAAAAKQYAALNGTCSFCGKLLEDVGSVEVGYGPVCARHWGLPHVAKGVAVLGEVPTAQQSNLLKGRS